MNRRPAAGFTLLELMLATVLTVLLMMGVMMVIATLRSSPALAAHDGPSPADPSGAAEREVTVARWIDLLREDLRHARTVTGVSENTVRLVGPLGLDAAGRAITHRPVEVVYRLVERDGRMWLFREQAALDLPSNRHRQRDLVLTGVTGFTLQRRVLPPAANEVDATGMFARAVGQVRPMPTDIPEEPDAEDEPPESPERPERPESLVEQSPRSPRDRGVPSESAASPAPGDARPRVAWSLRWTDGSNESAPNERFLLIRMEEG